MPADEIRSLWNKTLNAYLYGYIGGTQLLDRSRYWRCKLESNKRLTYLQ